MEADDSRSGATRTDDELYAIARASIGATFGLSEAQSRRLHGATAAEIRADAKAMARELGLEVDNDDRGRDERGRFAESGSSMNALIRQASGRR
jgi:hypothetical protein